MQLFFFICLAVSNCIWAHVWWRRSLLSGFRIELPNRSDLGHIFVPRERGTFEYLT